MSCPVGNYSSAYGKCTESDCQPCKSGATAANVGANTASMRIQPDVVEQWTCISGRTCTVVYSHCPLAAGVAQLATGVAQGVPARLGKHSFCMSTGVSVGTRAIVKGGRTAIVMLPSVIASDVKKRRPLAQGRYRLSGEALAEAHSHVDLAKTCMASGAW